MDGWHQAVQQELFCSGAVRWAGFHLGPWLLGP